MEGKKKEPFYKKNWFIIITGLIAIGIIWLLFANYEGVKPEGFNNVLKRSLEDETSYTYIETYMLRDELEENPSKAAETFKGKKIAVEGKLSVIDSSVDCLIVEPIGDDSNKGLLKCFIQNDEQRDIVAGLEEGNIILVKGKVTDIKEDESYSVNIDEVKETLTKRRGSTYIPIAPFWLRK